MHPYERTIEMIRERLGANPLAVQVPIGIEAEFAGAVDLFTECATVWEDQLGAEPREIDIPADLVDQVAAAKEQLVESIAETDDDLTLKYLEGEEITIEELKSALRKAVIAGQITPVYCGTSLRNKGVQPFWMQLLIICHRLWISLQCEVSNLLLMKKLNVLLMIRHHLVPWSLKLLRILMLDVWLTYGFIPAKSKQGASVYNSSKDRKERIGRLIRMYADRREDIEDASAGDIAAVLGLKHSFTGDTLCDASNQVVLENITFPEPVISVAIEPKTLADQDKMSLALQEIVRGRPNFSGSQ